MARLPTLSNLDPTKFYIDPSGRSFDRVREIRESTPTDISSRARLDGNYEPVLSLIRGQQQQLADNVAKRDTAIGTYKDQSARADRQSTGALLSLFPKSVTGAGLVTLGARVGSDILQGGTVQRYSSAVPVIGDELASGLDTIGNALGKVDSFSQNVNNALGKVAEWIGFGGGTNPNPNWASEAENVKRMLSSVPVTERYDYYNNYLYNPEKMGYTVETLKGQGISDPWNHPRFGINSANNRASYGASYETTRQAVAPYVVPWIQQDLLAAQKASVEEQEKLAQQRIAEQAEAAQQRASERAAAAQQFAESKPAQQQSLGTRLGATSLFSDDLHQQMLARNK